MFRQLAALAVVVAAAALAACAGHYAGNDATSYALPGMPDLKITAKLPNGSSNYIDEELPFEGIGTVNDTFWSATLGGFTQQQYAQALGFPPGTQITLTNISTSIHHTLNVVEAIKGPPANFPSNPKLLTTAHGKFLKTGFRSGAINPGSSVSVLLKKKGIYLIGCAFHYADGMRDVLVVEANATPGPQGTPPAQ